MPTLVINSLYPIYDQSNNLLGVFHSGVRLRSISRFLSQLKFSPSGQTFIMELNGNLVATSTQDTPYRNQSNYLTPLNAKNSDNPIISAIASLKINHPRSEIADHVTLSLGVFTVIPNHNNTIEDFIKTTDQALYLAKSKGRNRIYTQ